MPTDAELLRRYANEKSEVAFGELVGRQLNLVYAVALRQCGGDAHLAEDVTQRVFADLARKARQLSGHAVLGGWLYRSAQFAATDVVRAERRRRAREQEAQAMHETSRPDPAVGDAEWQKLAPVLDEAIGELAARDRDAVVLRFFEGRPFAEIGATLRLTEDAARMRVERALEKLRSALIRRGIDSTTAAIGMALANQVAAAAPVGLAATVAGVAMTGAAASSGGGMWLAFLTMSKIKVGIASGLALAAVATGVVELRANRELRAELGALRAGGDDSGLLQKENQRLNGALQKLGTVNPQAGELARARNRIAILKARPPGVIDAEIRPPQNRGRATPAAAIETFCWAIEQQDLDRVASFMNFSDDTKENREAFMANFSAAVRARYQTPERVCAAAFFGVGYRQPDPALAVQVVSVEADHGPDEVKIKLWGQNASGQEWAGGDRYVRTPEGWTEKPISLLKDSLVKGVRERLDPATGDFVPAKGK